MKLRDYQEDLITNARRALKYYKALQIQSATGSGKTATASHMILNSTDKGLISGFCVHRKELLEQTANTFDNLGIDFGIVASGYAPNYFKPVQIFSIDTLKNRLDSLPVTPHILHIDESHHAKADGWYKTIDHFKKKNSYVIGWSATPQRLDGKPLDVFDGLIQGPQPRELIKRGHLAEYELYSFPCEQGVVVGNLVSNWIAKGKRLKTIGFAKTVKLAEEYASTFRAAGISSIALDANTDKAERRQALIDFAQGKINVIWNCRLFGEGYDIAANTGLDVRVGCVIDAASSQSLTDWIQRCGRALRPNGESVILDAAGNYFTHGEPCMDRTWTLEGREAQKELDGLSNEQMRTCDVCHHSTKGRPLNCPSCGTPFPKSEIRVEHMEADLKKIDVEEERRLRRLEQAGAKTAEDLQAIEEGRGYKEGWSAHVEKARKEKEELRREVFNLCVVAKQVARVNTQLPSKKDIYKMKPKELKQWKGSLEGVIAGLQQA